MGEPTTRAGNAGPAAGTVPRQDASRPLVVLLLVVLLLVLVSSGGTPVPAGPRALHWSTLFVALMVQALPFLVLGVLISGIIAAYVSPQLIERVLPKNETRAVGAATCAGFLLPGCECGSVPIAGRLVARGVVPSAALAFMLAAPAVNPIVVVSTAVAFPGEPEMVVARILASFLTSLVVALIWGKTGASAQLIERLRGRSEPTGDRFEVLTSTTRHDLLHAGGFLVIGAAVAAAAQALLPGRILETLAGSVLLAVIVMTVLAIVLSICSEADAFVASGFSMFPRISLLAFMVVGPAVDLKLVAMQLGVFGRQFAMRFVPLSLAVALVATLVVGWVLL